MRYLSGDPPLLPVRQARGIPFDDIPTGRQVRGMGVTAGSDEHSLFRPYVYRGTGEDQHPTWSLDYTEPVPRKKPKRDPAKIRAANIKRRYGSKRKKRPRPQEYVSWCQPPPAAPEPEPVEPAHTVHVAKDGTIRPSAGWTPPTGEDIDAWLDEYDV